MTVMLAELAGVWRRSLLSWPGGQDTETTVLWVQGPTVFADLRQGTVQDGFAGVLAHDPDRVYEWTRRVDLNPPGPLPDRATLSFDGETLVEEGVAAVYTEHWHRLPDSTGTSGAMVLERSGTEAFLVRAGSYVAWATGEPEISIGRLSGRDDRVWEIGWSSVPGLVGERRELGAGGWRVVLSEGVGL